MKKEQSYGVVVVLKEEENKFLILQHADTKDDNWSFPKGHIEAGETSIQTAMRELEEESGITQIQLLDTPLIYEGYEINHHGEKCLKVNEYYIGFVDNRTVKIQDGEIASYKWATYEEALETFNYKTRKETLKTANDYLKNMIK